jgi:ubiquinone/menaquinone biosynthesis C-methylase UbiE
MSEVQQEQTVSAAFSLQSPSFDKIDEENELILWVRDRVRTEVLQYLSPKADILELNCGTGIDAIFFAQQGHNVNATDNAEGMLRELNKKVSSLGLQDKVQSQRCSFNNLEELGFTKQYDYVFSNFGGLNCTDNLAKILGDVYNLLKPGGKFSFVIMPRFCPWEVGMFLRGYFKTAFRRFAKNGTMAHLEGEWFKCYYYNPSFVIKHTKDKFSLVSLRGLSIVVPPPFIEGFIKKHPSLFKQLQNLENKIWGKSPFNRCGDHYIITMQKL